MFQELLLLELLKQGKQKKVVTYKYKLKKVATVNKARSLSTYTKVVINAINAYFLEKYMIQASLLNEPKMAS